jgi:transcription initiation factor TFIIE subunit alpha
MPYEHTSLTSAQTATIQLLVSQVARALFDPPYVVILERLMTTRDLWGEMELTHAVGLGPAKKELNKFMVGMLKQRLVKRSVADYHRYPLFRIILVDTPSYAMSYHSYVNTERKVDQAIVQGKFARPNVQRTYYYIDYHDFTDVVKYRLAVMRQKLEATLKVASVQ